MLGLRSDLGKIQRPINSMALRESRLSFVRKMHQINGIRPKAISASVTDELLFAIARHQTMIETRYGAPLSEEVEPQQ